MFSRTPLRCLRVINLLSYEGMEMCCQNIFSYDTVVVIMGPGHMGVRFPEGFPYINKVLMLVLNNINTVRVRKLTLN